MNPLPMKAGDDPVCKAIESLLRDLEAQGRGDFGEDRCESGVRLRFAATEVTAPTYDIALVRLANRLLDDPIHSSVICDLLRNSVESELEPG
jgi:hypothetical protein